MYYQCCLLLRALKESRQHTGQKNENKSVMCYCSMTMRAPLLSLCLLNIKKSSLADLWLPFVWATRRHCGKKFENNIQVEEFVCNRLLTQPTTFYFTCIKKFPVCWEKCLECKCYNFIWLFQYSCNKFIFKSLHI